MNGTQSSTNGLLKMAKELHSLGWDYLMFALFVAFTVFTPLWKRLFGKAKQRSKADYVFATGGVSLIAVMISIARGTLGVRTVLGYPSELYYYGTAMWEVIYGMASAYPIVCFVFVPIYFNLGITSVYQYLDLRPTCLSEECSDIKSNAIRPELSHPKMKRFTCKAKHRKLKIAMKNHSLMMKIEMSSISPEKEYCKMRFISESDKEIENTIQGIQDSC
uniref:Uncharacterized protein n=1 Tax=Glossina pallidipes TaxID=7398 RepID=A0A1A9ZG69_GLOPL